jgi:predicted nucleic acid-binding protein
MPEFLLDTSILIRNLRRDPAYRDLLKDLTQQGDLYIASYTRVEIIRGMREHERERTYTLLDSLLTVPLDAHIANMAGELVRSWRGRGVILGDPDAIIAATALSLHIDLVTTNSRHFPMTEIAVWQADAEGKLNRR